MVCYCATTERDLADGIGPVHELAAAGASICVGSDSHAIIDLFEEARGVELHARLATGRRGVFAPDGLLASATSGGAESLGFPHRGLEAGSAADFVVIDPDSPRLAGIQEATALETLVFSATAADVADVFVAGAKIVESGAHPIWGEAERALSSWPGR
jgi:cytosine/adenosine deaminase-related metal-dependent hydrolase